MWLKLLGQTRVRGPATDVSEAVRIERSVGKRFNDGESLLDVLGKLCPIKLGFYYWVYHGRVKHVELQHLKLKKYELFVIAVHFCNILIPKFINKQERKRWE
jgi:hypothetical protein